MNYPVPLWALEADKVNSQKSLQIQKTYEALFALEDLREIFRQSLPTGLSLAEREQLSNAISRVKEAVNGIEKAEGKPPCNKIGGKLEPRTREEEFIGCKPRLAVIKWQSKINRFLKRSPNYAKADPAPLCRPCRPLLPASLLQGLPL